MCDLSLYHFHVTQIKRSTGQSAIASAAYRSGEKLYSQYYGETSVNPTELNAELLHTLIEKIVIHESVKGKDGTKEQEVEIYYRFIGKID